MPIAFLPGASVSAVSSLQPGGNRPGVLDNLGGLGAALANIIRLGKKPNINRDVPSLQSALNAAEASRIFADASVNPESPYFKNLAALEEASIRRDLITAINEIMKSNARAKASGRVGFGVNPERRDEARSGALARAFAQAGEQSRRVASDKLRGAAGASAASAGAFAPTTAPFMHYADMGRSYEASRIQQIGDLGQWLADMMSGKSSRPRPGHPMPQPPVNTAPPWINPDTGRPTTPQQPDRTQPPPLIPFGSYYRYPDITVTR